MPDSLNKPFAFMIPVEGCNASIGAVVDRCLPLLSRAAPMTEAMAAFVRADDWMRHCAQNKTNTF